jgi:hypothetical protein
MTDELKPCPFCGGRNIRDTGIVSIAKPWGLITAGCKDGTPAPIRLTLPTRKPATSTAMPLRL